MRAVALLAVVVIGTSMPASSADPYRLEAFRWKRSQVRVIRVTAGNGVVVKRIMAYPTFSGRRTTSGMGIRSDSIAATNGDFNVYGTDAPRRQSVIDGEVFSTGAPEQPGFVLRTTASGHRATIGRPVFDARVTQGRTSFRLAGWNAQQPRSGSVVAFTARGGDDRKPSARNCSALLAPVSRDLAQRRYDVVAVRDDCSRAPLQPPDADLDWVVLHGREVRALEEGPLRMRLSVGLGAHARQVLGGGYLLVDRGVNVTAERRDGIFSPHPRTALGITRGCKDRGMDTPCRYLMVTVDGRRPGWSEGVGLRALGRLMTRLGAYEAMNLDGGGSTTMWTRSRGPACEVRRVIGCLVNRPSGAERPVVDGVGVVPV